MFCEEGSTSSRCHLEAASRFPGVRDQPYMSLKSRSAPARVACLTGLCHRDRQNRDADLERSLVKLSPRRFYPPTDVSGPRTSTVWAMIYDTVPCVRHSQGLTTVSCSNNRHLEWIDRESQPSSLSQSIPNSTVRCRVMYLITAGALVCTCTSILPI